jgi:purine-binding chemotaxis protein CheW
MVDLVKLRKKAKKKDDDAAAAAAETQAEATPQEPAPAPAPVQESTAPPAAPAPPSPKKEVAPAPAPAEPHEPVAEGPSKLERFMAEAGRKREAVVTAAAAATEEDHTLLELLTFVIAGEQYAVDIEHIVEIVRPRPLTRIPNADESIVGIASLRGTIVTLVDAHLRLGHASTSEQTDDTRTVVVARDHETLGFTVDRVLRVVKVAADAIEPHPVVHSSEQHDAIRGVFRIANALTILLDLDKLLDHKARSTESGARGSRLAQR